MNPQTKTLELRAESAGLALVDVQERLAAAMPEEWLRTVLRNIHLLLETARRLGLPVVVSEQYSKGLGPTLPVVAEKLLDFPASQFKTFEKVDFDCTMVDGWATFVSESGRSQWIITGMESHVCVYQTVRGLVGRGLSAHVVSDAAASRTEANRRIGLDLCAAAGAVVTSTETVAFDLLKRAGTEEFKAVQRLIR